MDRGKRGDETGGMSGGRDTGMGDKDTGSGMGGGMGDRDTGADTGMGGSSGSDRDSMGDRGTGTSGSSSGSRGSAGGSGGYGSAGGTHVTPGAEASWPVSLEQHDPQVVICAPLFQRAGDGLDHLRGVELRLAEENVANLLRRGHGEEVDHNHPASVGALGAAVAVG